MTREELQTEFDALCGRLGQITWQQERLRKEAAEIRARLDVLEAIASALPPLKTDDSQGAPS